MANPKIRFKKEDGTEYQNWEERKLGNIFYKVSERNNGQFDRTKWISVAKMYYQEPKKVTSNNIDTRTYVLRKGDMAFEGHSNSEFAYGRFVVNDIGDGVISELFPIYRHKEEYILEYWKYAIQIESIMTHIYRRAITSSGASSNKLNDEDFLKQSIYVPCLEEQKKIADFLCDVDEIIRQSEEELKSLEVQKKGIMQKIFSQEVRFKREDGSDYPDWEEKKLKDIASYVIGTMIGIKSSYVGTENMRKNCAGVDFDNNNVDMVKGVAYRKEDILISNIRPYLKKVWKADRDGICSSDVLCIRNTDNVTSDFLYTILSQDDFFSYVMSAVKGTKMPRGDKKHIMEANFFIPILEEQQKIANCLLTFDEVIISTKQEIEKWKELKKGLLQRMFV